MCPVNSSSLNPLVSGSFESTTLERVVSDVSEQSAGVSAGCILKRRCFLVGVVDEEFWNVSFFFWHHVPRYQKQHSSSNDSPYHLPFESRVEDYEREKHYQEEISCLSFFQRFLLVSLNYFLALSCRNRSHLWLVWIVGIRVNQYVLKVFSGEKLCHCIGKHGLACTGGAYQHDVSFLHRSFFYRLYCVILTDYLIYQSSGYLYFSCCFEFQTSNEFIHIRGQSKVFKFIFVSLFIYHVRKSRLKEY